MKGSLFVCLAVMLVARGALCVDADVDETELDALFTDKDKVAEFFDCMLEVVDKCSDENEMRKGYLPTIYATECGECTDAQKALYENGNQLMRENYPGKFDELLKKWKSKSL